MMHGNSNIKNNSSDDISVGRNYHCKLLPCGIWRLRFLVKLVQKMTSNITIISNVNDQNVSCYVLSVEMPEYRIVYYYLWYRRVSLMTVVSFIQLKIRRGLYSRIPRNAILRITIYYLLAWLLTGNRGRIFRYVSDDEKWSWHWKW